MMKVFTLALAASMACVATAITPIPKRPTPADAVAAFKKAGLTPEIVPVFKPITDLGVTFFFNSSVKSVDLGTNFTMPQTANRPIWSIGDTSSFNLAQKFVVIMFDPDAPTPQQPNESQIRHFVGGGFLLGTPTPLGTPLFNTTPALSDFLQPSPPATSDPHRYTHLLFKQPSNFPTSITPNVTDFNVTAFAKQTGLGEPLAGNFFTLSIQPNAVRTDPGTIFTF